MFDLKSYISQSRCDVSPFNRSGSYRSHHERERQEFQNVQNFQNSQNSQNSRICNSLSPWYRSDCQGPEDLSPSRKDSGVRSNSRRSSIQQQLYHMNKNAVTQNRVSGYFTSSQSSLVDETMLKNMPMPLPSPATNDQSAAYPGNLIFTGFIILYLSLSKLQLLILLILSLLVFSTFENNPTFS